MTHTYRFAAILGLGVLAVVGCNSSGPSAEKKTGAVIANVGNDTITVDDFKAKLDEQSPFIRARYTTLDRKKEFLDNLIRFEVLAQEAQRRGLDKDPEVLNTVKKVMVQKLIRAEFDDAQAGKDIPDEELKKYYDEHLEDYVKPERVRVSHLFIAAPEGPGRAKVKSEAAKLLAEVKGKEAGTDKTAFLEAAKAKSNDDATKAAGGDLSFKTKEELTGLWGAKFADAAMNLKAIGEIGDLVETEKGFHLLKLTGRQNALDRPFDQVKPQIQNRLSRDKRTKAFDDFVAGLKMKANVKVDEAALDKIEVAPAGPDGAAPAMNLPAGTPPSAAGMPAPAGMNGGMHPPAGMNGGMPGMNPHGGMQLQMQVPPAGGATPANMPKPLAAPVPEKK
jgi:peptidyl-prolyl cis-trans isomerase C